MMQKKPLFYISNANHLSLPDSLNTDDTKDILQPRGGLCNLGNTCYMNAAVQSLVYTSLTEHLIGMNIN